MSTWSDLNALIARIARPAISGIVEAVRTVFEGDPQTRRRVAFSIAMIALSAKMAKADGIVTLSEVGAFREIFAIPEEEQDKVSRLYNLAKQDTAGYETYARQMAGLCGGDEAGCPVLEDILDGLFHIAKADGVVHDRELGFLTEVARIFRFTDADFARISARHVDLGKSDPYIILGIARGAPYEAARKRYLELVRENHPDRLAARGVPEEFLAIASSRIAAVNAAWDLVEPELKAA